jgi:hypothetical protein
VTWSLNRGAKEWKGGTEEPWAASRCNEDLCGGSRLRAQAHNDRTAWLRLDARVLDDDRTEVRLRKRAKDESTSKSLEPGAACGNAGRLNAGAGIRVVAEPDDHRNVTRRELDLTSE